MRQPKTQNSLYVIKIVEFVTVNIYTVYIYCTCIYIYDNKKEMQNDHKYM